MMQTAMAYMTAHDISIWTPALSFMQDHFWAIWWLAFIAVIWIPACIGDTFHVRRG